MAAIDELLTIMKRLRDPQGGCPWDLEQDFASLAPYAIEEAYEVQDAIAKGDMDNFKEELGDLLLQIVFQSEMARQAGLFTFDDVAKAISDKMVSRHPHVFGEADAATAGAVLDQWDAIKDREKAAKVNGKKTYLLDDVPVALPALTKAQKLQKKAAKVGFDWAEASQVLHKIKEEISELEEAISEDSSTHIEEEFGDLLFAFVNLGRKLGLDTETALTKCNNKFYRRFNGIEDEVNKSGKEFKDFTLDQLEEFWVQQKLKEKVS